MARDREREQFEAWAKGIHYPAKSDRINLVRVRGKYWSLYTYLMWEAWKQALVTSALPQSEKQG